MHNKDDVTKIIAATLASVEALLTGLNQVIGAGSHDDHDWIPPTFQGFPWLCRECGAKSVSVRDTPFPPAAAPTPAEQVTEQLPDEISYTLPGAPPTERRVSTASGSRVWQRGVAGDWQELDDYTLEPLGEDSILSWHGLLALHGPVFLVPLTPQEEADALLYGPPGARWGDIHTPCPFHLANFGGGGDPSVDYGACALKTGHIGAHLDWTGEPMGMTTADGERTTGNISLAESTARPCTCGHPEAHRPGCERYGQAAGFYQSTEAF